MITKLLISSFTLALCTQVCAQRTAPNIVFILADDMGYGDVAALNAECKLRTPYLDKMVENGVSFTDAHTSSSVSTPTRYGILTGRYNWRSTLKQGVLNGYSKALIPEGRTTMASLLKKKDYTTGCVGKWHLGWNWNFKQKPTNLNNMEAHDGKGEIDYTKPIGQGPTTLGFDYFYGFSGSLDMPPYVYVENDQVTTLPNRETVNSGMGFWRKGPTGADFVHEETLPHLTDQAISFISREVKNKNPFFLYLPYPAPHTPILPNGEWIGKSGLNAYGDFVMMLDHEVGRILSALEKLGVDENTLIVFTSDNGCSPQAKFEELHNKGHNPSYIYRGMKADLFEGGHRVPCIVQWKESLKAGCSSQTICLTDFFATFADIAGVNLQDDEGEDSYSLLSALKNPQMEQPIRKATIHHSITGEFAIRQGDWKLLVSPSSGGWSDPRPNNRKGLEGLPLMQLYNLKNDPGEKKNLYSQELGTAKKLLEILREQISAGRSTPGKSQHNDIDGEWKQLHAIMNPSTSAVSRDEMTNTDLKEQLRWLKIESIELAINEMSKDASFNKGAAMQQLCELKMLIKKGFSGIEQNDPEVISRARKVLCLQQNILLSNPLLKDAKIVAARYKLDEKARNVMTPKLGTQSNNWTNQQSNAYRGYNAEIVELSNFGKSVKDRLIFKPSNGAVIADLRLHWDADRLIFTSVTTDDRLNVFEVKMDGSAFHPLIETEEPDLEFYDGIYLPDKRIIAISNIGYQAVPCIHGDGPVGNTILYNPLNRNIRRLTFDQDANWNPVVRPNGRIMYTRWEYTDLMHYYSRFVMHMNPDGTEQKALYGSGEMFPNSTFDIQPLPGHSSAFSGIISGHHGVARSGRLILFDPLKANKGAAGMLQEIPYRNRPVKTLEKDELVNDVWPQFIKPMPITDKYFLVSAKLSPESLWGIYLVDVFDNMICLHQEEGEGFISPLLVKKRPIPPVVPDRVKAEEKEATVFIQDIYEGEGLRGVPRGIVKQLRIHAYEYAYNKSSSNHEAMGIQSGWDIKRNLGTVPVESDGSALFMVPANTPISIQPLDADGRAIQWMRSWLTAMPGEVVSCIGCHEDQNTIVIPKRVMASLKKPIRLTSPEGGIRPFTFDLEIQPLLDRACISCHDGGKGLLDLRGGRTDNRGIKEKVGFFRYGIPEFSTSYLALHPYVRRQGSEADMKVLQPYEYYANTSELVRMLEIGHHQVQLTKEEWLALTNWIDYNAPEKGVFKSITPLKGRNQYERRIELTDKYASGAGVRWKDELKEYTAYLHLKGTVEPRLPKQVKIAKRKSVKVKGWPFSPEQAQKLQQAAGETRISVELTTNVKINFVKIPAGRFLMGANKLANDHQPAHQVKIDQSFWMAETEITNEQYKALVPEHDSRYVDQLWKDHVNAGYPANLSCQPVIRVSYQEAMNFCRILSQKTGLKITLPTETQWEWACRAGSADDFWFGALDADFSKKENLADASLSDLAVTGVDPKPMSKSNPFFSSYNYQPKEVRVNDGKMIQGNSKEYQPNPFGLYSMHGNIAEWTCSPYLSYPHKKRAKTEIVHYVVRGGSYLDRPQYSTAYVRKAYFPWQRVFNVGFRVVME